MLDHPEISGTNSSPNLLSADKKGSGFRLDFAPVAKKAVWVREFG
jgi:hypothetical protein